MSKAQLCPVCMGAGKIFPDWEDLNYMPDTKELKIKVTCHGCGGKGWVVVPTLEQINHYKNRPEGE